MRWVLLALLLVPLAGAQGPPAPPLAVPPTHHTLFLHAIDAMGDLPMNTQEPPPGYARDFALSPTQASLSCFPGAPLGTGDPSHTTYGYPTPTLVDYGGASDGSPRVRPERGIGLDVAVTGGMTLNWYLSPDAAVLALPNVVVQATVRTGSAISVDNLAYNDGAIIAQGRTGPVLLAGAQTAGARHHDVGGRAVYHFEVPLALESDVLPREGAFNVRVDTYLLRDDCPAEGYAMPAVLAIHTSAGLRPRLEFDGAAPYHAAFFRPSIADGRVVVETAVTTAWGFYDVHDVELAIAGPSAAPTVYGFIFDPRVAGTPFGLTDPFSGTWTWDTEHDAAEAGHYEATFTVTDAAGARHQVAHAGFDLEPEQESPGLPAVAILALFALVAALRRR